MKHLQLFEDYSSAPAAGAKDQQIAKMIQEATNDFNFRTFSDWDEEKIKDAFLMIKTKPEFLAANKAINSIYEKMELSKGRGGVKYPATVGIGTSKIPAQGNTGYVTDDPNFDWLFEIYYTCFSNNDRGFNIGGDEALRKTIINHLVNSKIVDLKAPLRAEMSPFASGVMEIRNGDWKCLGL